MFEDDKARQGKQEQDLRAKDLVCLWNVDKECLSMRGQCKQQQMRASTDNGPGCDKWAEGALSKARHQVENHVTYRGKR
jgi:hypothetical protein